MNENTLIPPDGDKTEQAPDAELTPEKSDAEQAVAQTEEISDNDNFQSPSAAQEADREADRVESETERTPAEGQAQAVSGGYKRRKGFRYGCYLFAKRFFDIVSSGTFLLVFSWLYIILAIVVKCSDGGKVVYKHKRVGKNRKTIYLPKFRSMKKDADKLEDMLTPEQLEQYKREYKIDDDPRVTKIGKFLRKTSLDELPNIWAIFVGRISVIGPRPLMSEELEEKYGADADKLVSVRPGMIGWWAANGRSNVTYESGERQKLELYYIDHCSVGLDIKIIFKTLISVFKHTGAK